MSTVKKPPRNINVQKAIPETAQMGRPLRKINIKADPFPLCTIKNDEFCHLHVHNEFSFLDGYGSAEAYAERAKVLGFEHLALTNHGGVEGCIRFQRACDKQGIHAILGMEAYIVEDMSVKIKGEKRPHVTLLAKNGQGWENLLQLVSYSNIQGFHYRPRIDPFMLKQYVDGLIVMTGCCSGFIRLPSGRDLLYELAGITEVFLEIMPVGMAEQREMNDWLLEIHKESDISMVATMDCHYPLAEHAQLQEVLLAMQSKKKWDDPNRWKFDIDDLYLKSPSEMWQAFESLGGLSPEIVDVAMRNTINVANLCDFHHEPIVVALPKVDVPQYRHLEEQAQLIQLTVDGLTDKVSKHDWIAGNIDVYYERIEEELGLIMELGFERYFLIVWELIKWCKEHDIMCGPGRGSVGGCLCAFLLGITSVDSILWDLPFSRFMSQGRIDLPDIDMDFEDTKRDQIRGHLGDLYGEFNVVSLSTFARLSGRSAIRDVSRVFDIPKKDVDAAAKSVVMRSLGDFRASFTIEDAFSTFEDGIKFRTKYPEVADIAMNIEGQIKGAGKHAAAMCVSKYDLRTGKNTSYAMRTGELICSFDKYDAEDLGLMKLDVLGLNALTVLAQAKKLVMKRHGIDIDYESIPLFGDSADADVLSQFTTGNTAGVFQFASHSMVKLCREIHTEDFEQVISLNALNRPGCLRSGMATDYKERKHNEKPIPKMHPIMGKITESTFGIVLYQEQIMYIMYQLAGLPWKTADMVRKVISKSTGEEQFLKFKQMFIDGCSERGTLPPEESQAVFEELKHFGSYGFNRAHSVEYAMIAYWDMYLKVHYPVEFIMALLSYGQGGDKKLEHVDEAKRMGIKILLPNINDSEAEVWTADDEGRLRIPFCEIKGIGEITARKIVEARSTPYTSKENFESRVDRRKVNKRIVELLETAGAFDDRSTDDLSEQELDHLSDLFEFELSNDPMYRYKKMYQLLEQNLSISKLINVTTAKDSSKRLYFGRMLNVKFGYKEKVKDSKTGADTQGLGGVYGNLDDGTDFAMLTFSSTLYEDRKDKIEHCSGDWLLARGSSPFKTDSVFADGVWFADDLLKGEAQGLGLELVKAPNYEDGFIEMGVELFACESCELRSECTNPVLPSPGQYNIMANGEGPGYNEDQQGEGFVGAAGDMMWNGDKSRGVIGLSELGIERSMIHVTNMVKCYPKQTKTPKAKHINACSKWLEREIEIVKPFIILAFGNTNVRFFKGATSGIMDLSGETEWSDKYSCWICWSLHPAAVLYHSENAGYLNAGLSNFAEKIGVLGFGL